MIGGNLRLDQLRRRPHWSYSSLNLFLNVCQLQWTFRYVWKVRPAFTPAAVAFGAAFHRACAWAFARPGAGIAEAADQFTAFLAAGCRSADPEVRFDEDGPLDVLEALGRRMLEAYLASRDPAERVLATGIPFTVPLGGPADGCMPLVGEFDMVVECGGRREIVDIKTSARRWPEPRVRLDLQPTCYLLAAAGSPEERIEGFRFDVVTKTKVPAVERYPAVRDPDRFRRLVGCAKVAEEVIRRGLFLPADQGHACPDCPYGMACQGWHRQEVPGDMTLELAA